MVGSQMTSTKLFKSFKSLLTVQINCEKNWYLALKHLSGLLIFFLNQHKLKLPADPVFSIILNLKPSL